MNDQPPTTTDKSVRNWVWKKLLKFWKGICEFCKKWPILAYWVLTVVIFSCLIGINLFADSQIIRDRIKAAVTTIQKEVSDVLTPKEREVSEGTPKEKELAAAIQLKEYELHISLFQYYLTLGFSAFSFFCVMTGSILAYIFKNYEENAGKKKNPMLMYSLLLPILVSSVFTCIFFYGAVRWYVVRESVETLRGSLRIQKVPDLQILLQMLVLFAGILFLIGSVLSKFVALETIKSAANSEKKPGEDSEESGTVLEIEAVKSPAIDPDLIPKKGRPQVTRKSRVKSEKIPEPDASGKK